MTCARNGFALNRDFENALRFCKMAHMKTQKGQNFFEANRRC